MQVGFYVDGFNLYHAIDALATPRLKWLDLDGLARSFLRSGDALQNVTYFTAMMTWDSGKYERHRQYLSALGSKGVEIVISKFQQTKRYCNANARYCKFPEEKQTDIAFGSRILCDVFQQRADRVLIVTADSDQVPTVAAIRGMFPQIQLELVAPPNRIVVARELGKVVHKRHELTAGRLTQYLFPRNVYDSRGKLVAVSPARYQP